MKMSIKTKKAIFRKPFLSSYFFDSDRHVPFPKVKELPSRVALPIELVDHRSHEATTYGTHT